MDIEKVGKAIAYLRKRAGYTQKELADCIGISDKAVSKWERGQGLPEIRYLRKLSILLDTDSDSLLAGDVAHHKSDWKGIIVLDKNPDGIGAGTVIYDKPLISFLLSYFLLVGIRDIYIAGMLSDVAYIASTLGDGADYGIKLQTTTGGLKAVTEMILADEQRGAAGEKQSKIMLVYGRCFLYGVDQTRFFQKAMGDRSRFTMLVLPKTIKSKPISMNADKKIVKDGGDDLRTQYDYSQLPICFFPASMLPAMVPSISEFIEGQIDSIYVEMLDRGFVEIEVDNWNNVQEAATFLRIVQDKCGMNVYCLEEVAWRRGMIGLSKLKELGERKNGTRYGDYVLGLYERHSGRVLEG